MARRPITLEDRVVGAGLEIVCGDVIALDGLLDFSEPVRHRRPKTPGTWAATSSLPSCVAHAHQALGDEESRLALTLLLVTDEPPRDRRRRLPNLRGEPPQRCCPPPPFMVEAFRHRGVGEDAGHEQCRPGGQFV